MASGLAAALREGPASAGPLGRARMLWRNPLSALSHPQLMLASVSSSDEDPRAPATVMANRAGSVLGPNTMLKADHFPGCQHPDLPTVLEGAPNFRQVEGLPVYGVAIPTLDGTMRVLQAVDARPGGSVRALWHNMREEPVLYIRGKPYVLREASRPFKNLQEYTGIDTARLEAMELRLKEDVLKVRAGRPPFRGPSPEGELLGVPHTLPPWPRFWRRPLPYRCCR